MARRRSNKLSKSQRRAKRRNNKIKNIVNAKDPFERQKNEINERRQSCVNTRSFRDKQSFGAASECVSIDRDSEEFAAVVARLGLK